MNTERASCRAANRDLNIAEFEDREVVLKSLPRAIFVELTENCNLHCPYCRSGRGNGYTPSLDMPHELFHRLAEELFPTAELIDLRGWGESTILPSFLSFVDIAASYGAQLRLVTNGMNPEPVIWKRLMAYRSILVISCDTADPNLFRKIRRGGNLETLTKTITTIVKYRDRYRVPNENVYLTCVVSSRNVEQLSELITFANECGLRKVILFPIMIKASHPWNLRNCIESARKGLISAIETANALEMTLQLGAAFHESFRLLDDIKKICVNPWSYALIDYAGRVGYCDHLIGDPRYTLGSMKDSSFKKIWNNKHFIKLRNSHAKGRFPLRHKKCKWCYKMRYVDFEHFLFPKFHQGVVSNQTRPFLC